MSQQQSTISGNSASTNVSTGERFASLASWTEYSPPEDGDPLAEHPRQSHGATGMSHSLGGCTENEHRQIRFQRYEQPAPGHGNDFTSDAIKQFCVPTDAVSAREVIESWDGELWQAAAGGTTELDQTVSELLRRSRRAIVAQPGPHDADALTFLIHAYLVRNRRERVYLAAPPSTVARLVAGLAAALPAALARLLSFSTFEPDLRQELPTVVVGTWWPTRALFTADLPQHCYVKRDQPNCWGFGFNSRSGRRSELPPDSCVEAYATFAAARLVHGPRASLEEFLAGVEAAGIADDPDPAVARRELTLAYRDFRLAQAPSQLTADEASTLLASPTMGQLLHWEKAKRVILEAAAGPGHQWNARRVPGRLREFAIRAQQDARLAEALASLADAAVDQAIEFATRRDRYAAARLLDDVARLVDSANFPNRYARFLRGLKVDGPPTWDDCEWVLSRPSEVQAALTLSDVTTWLGVAPTHLQDLLMLAVPSEWRRKAIVLTLEAGDGERLPTKLLRTLFDDHLEAFEGALRSLAADASAWPSVLVTLAPLLTDPARCTDVVELVGRFLPKIADPQLGDDLLRMVDSVLDDATFTSFFETHIEILLAHLAGTNSVRDASRWYLAHLTVERAARAQARAAVEAVQAGTGVPKSIRAQAGAWQVAAQLVEDLPLAPDRLEALAEAAETLGRAHRDDLLAAVGSHLGPRVTDREALDLLLFHLTPRLVGNPLHLVDALQPASGSAENPAIEARRTLLLGRANELRAREVAESAAEPVAKAVAAVVQVGGGSAPSISPGVIARPATRTLEQAVGS